MAKASKAKLRSRDRRRREKTARKAANRARYALFIGTEANTKRKSRKPGATQPGHPHHDPCGNGACVKCSATAANDPWRASPGSCLYGKRWTSRKHRGPTAQRAHLRAVFVRAVGALAA